MIVVLLLLAALVVTAAAVAFSLRNLIHSALLLVIAWAGLAGVYLWAGAEFVAFAQALIYVGAVSMIVLFAVLLTRTSPAEVVTSRPNLGRAAGAIVVGAAVTAVLAGAVVSTSFPEPGARPPAVSVRQLGYQLMNQHAASLLVMGVILTVALIGATVLAAYSRDDTDAGAPPERDLRPDNGSKRRAAAEEVTTS